MITSTIGRIFLKAFNEKYKCDYDARTFFDEVYYKLFFDSNKYMFNVKNSPFFQPAYKNKKNEEKLRILHENIDKGAVDASVAVGYAASMEEKFATTSGQVTDINIPISKEEVYYSWIGAGLSVGVNDNIRLLFFNADILLIIYEGWKEYRKRLDTVPNLKDNEVHKWNSIWIYNYFGENRSTIIDYLDSSKNKVYVYIKNLSWTKIMITLANHFKINQFNSYVFILDYKNKANVTIGFIPFILPDIRRPVDLYRKLFGMSKEAEDLWGTEKGFRTCCQLGAIGVKAMAPKGVMKYIKEGIIPKVKKDDDAQRITFNTYIIWILAMLNNEELWEMSQKFAQDLRHYISSDEKKLSTKKTNLVEEKVLKSTNKKTFIDALTDLAKDAGNKEGIIAIAEEVNKMPTDNVPYFLTLIRFNYYAKNN